MGLTRRAVIATLAALSAAPRHAVANQSRELEWEDLIPDGVPYGEIVGDGLYDEQADIWIPEFDENAGRTTTEFDGMTVRIPGYIVPLDHGASGAITGFLLAPFAGACIHVPPPPPNQLVYVTSEEGWPSDRIWEAVWVTGGFRASAARTDLAEAGYEMRAEDIEIYEW